MSWNSGAMLNGRGTEEIRVTEDVKVVREPPAVTGPDLVAEARAALNAFHVEDQRTAKLLLMMWKRRIQLDTAQVDEILKTFPPTVDLDWEPGA